MIKEFKIPKFQEKMDSYDDSTIIKGSIIKLNDNRPILAQMWSESGYTYLTYFFSSEGIENFRNEEIFEYLQSEGVKLSKPITNPDISLITDNNQVECWRVTIIVGESEE